MVTNREVEKARAALKTIRAGTPQYVEASELLANFAQHEEDGKRAMQAAVAKRIEDDIDGRKEFARTAENNFLKNGMDVVLTTSGQKATTLNFRYVLVSPAVSIQAGERNRVPEKL